MIIILHGLDTSASYYYLSRLLQKYSAQTKIRLSEKNSFDDLKQNILTDDFFDSQKIIICENFIKIQKISVDFLKQIPDKTLLIFWESSQILAQTLTKLQNFARIIEFKPKTNLFTLLDLLGDNSQKILTLYNQVIKDEQKRLLWHITNRVLCLILVRSNLSREQTTSVLGQNIADWQWEKYKRQALKLDFNRLLRLFESTLKIDYQIKSSLTDLTEESLIPYVILKYFP